MHLNENESNVKLLTKSYSFINNQKKIPYSYYENNLNTQNPNFNFEKKTINNYFSNISFEKRRTFQPYAVNSLDINKPINFNNDILNFKRNKSVITNSRNNKIPNNIEYYIDENGNPNSFKNNNPLNQKKPIAYIITNNPGKNYLIDLNGEKINTNLDGDFYFPGQPFLLIKNFDVQNPELRVFGERSIFKNETNNKIKIDNSINEDDISFKNLTQPKIKKDIFNTMITNNNSKHLNRQKYLLFSSSSIGNNNFNFNRLSCNNQKKYYSLMNSGRNSNFMKQYTAKYNSVNNSYKLYNDKKNILPYNNKFQLNLKNNIDENVNYENFRKEKLFIDDDSFHQINEKNKKNISISSTCSTNKYKPSNKKLNSAVKNDNINSISSLNIYDIYYKKNCRVGCKIKKKKNNTDSNNKLIFNYERKNKNPIIINPLMKKETTDYNCYNNKNSSDLKNNENNFSLEKEKQKYYTKVNTNRKLISSILHSINQAAVNENKNKSKFISSKRINKYLLNGIGGISENNGSVNYYKKPQKINQINTSNKSLNAKNSGIRKTTIIKNRGQKNKSITNICRSNKIHNLIKNKSESNYTPIKNKYKEEKENEKLNIITNITKCPHCHYIFTQNQK